MENLTHSGLQCNVGGVPNYREIFGSFKSRAPSIPVLLLPQLDEADLFFDVGYSELFGDSDAADFAPSYQDLFAQPMGIPAEGECLSEESDQFIEDPCFSIEDPDQSFQGSKEFSISSNGLNHTAQEQDAPVYSFVVDQTAPLPKIASKSASLSRADNEECRGGLMGVKQFGKVMSRPSHANDGKVALDIHFVPQRGYDTNGSHCKDFVTISKISLQTEPSRLPPPSRPPPLLDVSKGGSSRSTSNCKSTDSAGTGCDTSPSFFDVEVDASSSAAAPATSPATAMKETIRKSLEKMKSAKELMERKGEGLQSAHTKPDSKNSINNKEGHLRKSSAEERRGRASTSSHCSDKIDGTDKWKEATQFFDLVKTDKPRKAVMQTNDELIWAQKVRLLTHGKKENEAGIEIYVQQEENAKKTIPVVREYELEEKKLKVAGEAFQMVENNERRKGAKDKHTLKEQENKVKIAQEVSEQEARMNVRTAQLHQQTWNKLNVAAKPGKYDYFEDGQQKIEDEQAKLIKENRHTMKKASKRRENEKEAKESYKIEIKQREVLNQEYIDNWVKEAMQQGANVKRIKEAIERDEKKKLKEVCQREDNEKILIEAVQQIENEKRPQGDPEQEWNETKLKEDRELEGKERRLSMTREREENRLKETRDKEENAKRLKEAHEKEKNEKRLEKECERIPTKKGLKETRSTEEKEKKLKDACEVEENEKKLKEANEQEGNQKIMKEACEREEHEKRENEVHQREKNKKRWREAFEQVGSAKEQKEAQKRNDNDKKTSEVEKRVEEFWQRENYTTSLKNDLEQEESEARLEVFVQNEAEKAPKEVTRWKETESLYKGTGERKYLRGLNKVHEQTKKYEKLELPNSTDRGNAYKVNRNVKGEPEGSDKNVKTVGMENMVVAERNKASGIFQANSEQKVENPRLENVVELHLLEDNLKKVGETGIGVGKTCINKSRKQAFNQAESKKFLSTVMGKEWVANGGKVEAVRPAVLEIRGNTQKTNNQVNGRQSTIIKDKNLNETCVLEERKTERTERERELEQQRLQKIEEMERERESEKDRMAVDKATLEACESAHEKAERAAVERVNAGAPQKTLSETHERLEKACAETSEESLQDKASMETRLRMERTAVERPTTEGREHAVFEAKEGMERSVSDKFSCSSRVGRMRLSSLSSNLHDLNSQSSGSFDGSRNLNFSASGASYDAERYKVVEVESAQRCRARLERHRRTEERAAKALEEKNMRDLLALREQAERHRLSETLDAEVKRWSSGKHGNLRALLSTLQYILGSDSGWQPIPLTEVITNAAVKKAYRKATLCIHPDKLQQRGASIQHKYICEKVYDLLKEAWSKFNSGEL